MGTIGNGDISQKAFVTFFLMTSKQPVKLQHLVFLCRRYFARRLTTIVGLFPVSGFVRDASYYHDIAGFPVYSIICIDGFMSLQCCLRNCNVLLEVGTKFDSSLEFPWAVGKIGISGESLKKYWTTAYRMCLPLLSLTVDIILLNWTPFLSIVPLCVPYCRFKTNSIPSLHWGLTWDSIAPARTQCVAAFSSEHNFFYVQWTFSAIICSKAR